MKPSLKAAAHLCIGLVAFFGVLTLGKWTGRAKSGAESAPPARKSQERETPGRVDLARRSMTSAEYQAAWDAIPAKKLGRTERLDLQIKLLKEWADKDLEGALKAALSESWNPNPMGTMRYQTFNFHSAFVDVFKNRPDDVWKLIQQRKLGILENAVLVKAWSSTLFGRAPALYLSYLREMKGGDFILGLNAADQESNDFNLLTEMLDLAEEKARQGVPMEGLNNNYLLGYAARGFTKDELMARLEASNAALADFYIQVMASRVTSAPGPPTASEISAEIQGMPAHKRDDFARMLLPYARGNTGVLRASLDHFVAEEKWGFLATDEAPAIVQVMARKDDPVELAEWAVNLPPREETSEMFHRGVEPYIRKSPEEAWNWIQGMDEGYWRDHALAEFSQVNLNVFNDPAKSAAAIAQIRDPAFLATVQGWRASWEKQKVK